MDFIINSRVDSSALNGSNDLRVSGSRKLKEKASQNPHKR